MISNLHKCFYLHYSLKRISPPFKRCLYAVFSYKHFLITVNYFWRLYTIFGGHILLSTAIYHFRRSYTTFDDYILHFTAIYYFRWLHTTFSFTLPRFCKNQSLSYNFLHLRNKYWAWFQYQFISFNPVLLFL